jgi:hypothetical protein
MWTRTLRLAHSDWASRFGFFPIHFGRTVRQRCPSFICSPARLRLFREWSAKLSYLETMPEMKVRHKQEQLPRRGDLRQFGRRDAQLANKRPDRRGVDEFCE